ncbi:hypothetical protein [Tuberibacillus calidus]|jgi:hypothetical protein|uniref:hypothetical protein n=1 Tax=Tuberibacillus calidus TaxID=340097 RepID=UPI00041A950D|nr:hypothetical protein [Tuberibacillus calidus]
MKWVEGGRYQIIYLDQNNHISSRRIRVLQERSYALTAFCYERRAIRSFLKENILAWQRLSDPREWLPDKKQRG